MTLFLILPVLLAWLLCAAGASAATRFVPQLRQLFPFVWRISLWASLGCCAALGALAWFLFVIVPGPQPVAAGSWAEQAYTMTVALAVFAGPVLAAAAGWSAGALIGLLLALSHVRRHAGHAAPV
jgi:hypothetical protein